MILVAGDKDFTIWAEDGAENTILHARSTGACPGRVSIALYGARQRFPDALIRLEDAVG